MTMVESVTLFACPEGTGWSAGSTFEGQGFVKKLSECWEAGKERNAIRVVEGKSSWGVLWKDWWT